MNMKKIVFALFALMILAGFTAQTQAQGVSFGLRAGFQMQNLNGKDIDGDALELDLVPRFNAGAFAEIPVAPDFYFQPALLFSTKGAKSSEEFLGQDLEIEFNLGYLELPLSLLYKPVLGNGRFMLGFGPYLGYGIAGKAKYSLNNTTTEEDIEWNNEYEMDGGIAQFKPLDFGANVFFGYELAMGLSFQLNTQLGLSNINPDSGEGDDESSVKNTGFGISLGYRF